MNRAADAVAAKFRNDAESAAPDFALHRSSDILCAIAGARCLQALAKGFFGAARQFVGTGGGWRDFDGDGGVGVVAVFFGSEVEFYEVTGTNSPAAGNSVNNFVVQADANVAGKSVDHRRRRMRAVRRKDLGTNFRKLAGRDAGTNFSSHGAQGFSNDDSAGAEFFELLGRGDGHSREL